MGDKDKQSVETPISDDDTFEILKKIAENLEKRKQVTKECPGPPLHLSFAQNAGELAELLKDISNKIGKLLEALMEFRGSIDFSGLTPDSFSYGLLSQVLPSSI